MALDIAKGKLPSLKCLTIYGRCGICPWLDARPLQPLASEVGLEEECERKGIMFSIVDRDPRRELWEQHCVISPRRTF